MSNQSQQSLRAKDAAAILGVGQSTFWRWIKTRPDAPAGRKLSRRVTVFDRDELIAWRDTQTAKTQTTKA